MKQSHSQKFESDCQKAIMMVENEMPLGSLFDFIANMKILVMKKMEEIEAVKQPEVSVVEEAPCCEPVIEG